MEKVGHIISSKFLVLRCVLVLCIWRVLNTGEHDTVLVAVAVAPPYGGCSCSAAFAALCGYDINRLIAENIRTPERLHARVARVVVVGHGSKCRLSP